MVEQLCALVDTFVEALQSSRRTPPRIGAIVSRALATMHDWIMSYPVHTHTHFLTCRGDFLILISPPLVGVVG